MSIIQKPTDCFSINKKFWKFLGISSSVQSKFYNWYSKTFILVFVIMYDILITLNLFYLPRDLDHFIEEMIFYFMELSVVSKVMTYMVMQRKITEIFDKLESQMFQPATKEGVQIIGKAMKFNVKYWKIVALVSYFSYSVHILSPFLAHLFLKVPLILSVCSYSFLTESIKQMFIYPLYLYQAVGMHMHMLYNIHIDTFFVGLMIFTIAQLEILEYNLSTITNMPRGLANGTDSKYSSIELRYIEELNKSVIHFREVIKFCDLIEEVFSGSLFVQFSMASCIICVCLFRFTRPAPVQYYMFLSTYLFIVTIIIMVPCFFGTQIMTKSCLLSQAIYDCDWTPRCRRFKSTMRLLVERANRPLSITGWKMFPLSLNTFTSIMNTAYSFFTLLRNMQTREH